MDKVRPIAIDNQLVQFFSQLNSPGQKPGHVRFWLSLLMFVCLIICINLAPDFDYESANSQKVISLTIVFSLIIIFLRITAIIHNESGRKNQQLTPMKDLFNKTKEAVILFNQTLDDFYLSDVKVKHDEIIDLKQRIESRLEFLIRYHALFAHPHLSYEFNSLEWAYQDLIKLRTKYQKVSGNGIKNMC